MGKHYEWRKLAKKLRRKRIRSALAIERKKLEEAEREKNLEDPNYRRLLEEQEKAEQFQHEEEERIAKEQHEAWLQREKEANIKWQELQKKIALAREEREKQLIKIKQEWEIEQKRLKALKDLKERQEEEKRKQEEYLKESIEQYLYGDGKLPEELLKPLHTNPNKELCLFFKKTGACRFGDGCSRNHVKPCISKIILIPNFYSHYSLENSNENEYGNDNNLEYEHHEMINHFKEFFYDVLPEMEKFGIVKQFKVCCNHESHLRGNVYVEYSSYKEAIKSYRVFQGRWYGGKQLNVEFSTVESWKSAICGLFFKNKCPKGNSCNFLHVFRNPGNLFQNADYDQHHTPPRERIIEDDSRNWRWSESPEPCDKRNKQRRSNSRSSSISSRRSHKSHRRRSRSRTRSSSRHRRKK